jgi:hypothetical protein
VSLVSRALELAHSQIGARETARNRGPEVDWYLRTVGLDPERGSYPWCAAFAYWCYRLASDELRVPCPIPRTASVHRMWERAKGKIYMPRRGAVFCIDKGGGKGHCGIVVELDWSARLLHTIEGNTNLAGSREGDGVYRRMRECDEVTLGYIDCGADVA